MKTAKIITPNNKKSCEYSHWTRRDFLWLMAVSTAGVTTGCATDPITGKPHLMLLSKYDEVSMDKEGAPHQFSADYGEVQDRELNRYIHEVGSRLAQNSHRSDMTLFISGG